MALPSANGRRRAAAQHGHKMAAGHEEIGFDVVARGLSSARIVSAGSYFSMAINVHGQLVWWGGDPFGAQQLAAKLTAAAPEDPTEDGGAVPLSRSVSLDTTLLKLWIPRSGRVVQVSAGGRHGVLLLDTGDVLTFGENESGQLGTGDHLPVASPRAVEALRVARLRCTEVSAGRVHTLVIDEAGTLLAWGSGQNGALGRASLDDALAPVRVELLGSAASLKKTGRIVSVSASDHCLAVTENGELFAWGNGRDGQLGCGDLRSHRRPRRVDPLRHVRAVAVSAGHAHSLVLTSTGEVYAFGRGSSGQLGRAVAQSSSLPVRVELNPPVAIAQVAAGGDHSLFLTVDGLVLTCGSGEFGVLGQGGTAPNYTPQRIAAGFGLDKVTAIAAGFLHSIVVSEVRQTFTFGSNASLQLGEVAHAYSSVPRLVYGLLAADAGPRTRRAELAREPAHTVIRGHTGSSLSRAGRAVHGMSAFWSAVKAGARRGSAAQA